MSKTLKKVFIFILLLIIVGLVIFLIEILLPKNHTVKTEPGSPSISASPSPSPTAPDAAPSGSPSQLPSPSPTDTGSVTTEETADGTKYTVSVPGGFVTYSITADSGLFEHVSKGGSEMLRFLKDDRAYIAVSFIQGISARDLAPSYLDSFIDYTEFEQSGQNYIDGTKITGETVTVGDGTRQVTAWLVNTDKGVLAVVMSLCVSESNELPTLEKVLSSLEIIK